MSSDLLIKKYPAKTHYIKKDGTHREYITYCTKILTGTRPFQQLRQRAQHAIKKLGRGDVDILNNLIEQIQERNGPPPIIA